eukprot:362710-Chlamydomonas_euryale.AAC.2
MRNPRTATAAAAAAAAIRKSLPSTARSGAPTPKSRCSPASLASLVRSRYARHNAPLAGRGAPRRAREHPPRPVPHPPSPPLQPQQRHPAIRDPTTTPPSTMGTVSARATNARLKAAAGHAGVS